MSEGAPAFDLNAYAVPPMDLQVREAGCRAVDGSTLEKRTAPNTRTRRSMPERVGILVAHVLRTSTMRCVFLVHRTQTSPCEIVFVCFPHFSFDLLLAGNSGFDLADLFPLFVKLNECSFATFVPKFRFTFW